jgi:hypothetical protein
MPAAPGAAGPPQTNKRKRFAWWGASSLAISIFLHGLFIAIAAIFVVAHFQKPKHANFQAAPPAAAHNEVEHKVELAKRTSSESAPPDLKRITTTGISAITLPDVPDSPVVDVVTPSPMSGVGEGTGLGSGGGGGGGNGNGSGTGDGLDLSTVSEQLSKLLFQLPCGEDKACQSNDDHEITVHVPDGREHTCTLLIRGIVEPKTYDGGYNPKTWLNVGGTPAPDTCNIYELSVDDPPQTYYLNAGKSAGTIYVIDYTMQIKIKDNSNLKLHSDSIDNLEAPNSDRASVPDNNEKHPIMVKQPYAGQFIQVDTLSIDDE